MTETSKKKDRRGLFGDLTAGDIVLTAGLAVIIGLVFSFWSIIVYPIGTTLLGPIGVSFLYGVWFLGGLIPAYIIRKPGVAFLGEFIASHVELLTGSPYGPLLTYYAVSQGLATELIFAAMRYRKWDLKVMLLAGAAPGLPAIAMDYYLYQYYILAPPLQLVLWLGYFGSGAVLGGALGKYVADSVARTGVLGMFPLGKEIRRQKKETIQSEIEREE
jgi:energy-coupling factor transport system substrate-specific component